MHIGHQNGQTIEHLHSSSLTATIIERQTKNVWIRCHCSVRTTCSKLSIDAKHVNDIHINLPSIVVHTA